MLCHKIHTHTHTHTERERKNEGSEGRSDGKKDRDRVISLLYFFPMETHTTFVPNLEGSKDKVKNNSTKVHCRRTNEFIQLINMHGELFIGTRVSLTHPHWKVFIHGNIDGTLLLTFPNSYTLPSPDSPGAICY